MVNISGRSIEQVQVIDDDVSFRQTLAATVEEAQLRAMEAVGPLGNLDAFLVQTMGSSQAALCDHHLRKKAIYATFNGASAVAELYKRNFPAVLCTAWDKANADEIRSVRRFVPSLINPSQLDPDTFVAGLATCIDEFCGKFRQDREPSRAIVRVEDSESEKSGIYVVVPSFSPHIVIRLVRECLPDPVVEAVTGGKARFYAYVNLGAEAQEELFFERWEVP